MGRDTRGRLVDPLRALIALLLALTVVSCDGTASAPVPEMTPTRTRTPTSDTSSGPAAPSPGTTAAGSSIVSSVALTCRNFIGHDPPPPDFEIVLGVVALATTATAALQTARGDDPDPALRLFAKTGLLVRTGTTFELVVPAEARTWCPSGGTATVSPTPADE